MKTSAIEARLVELAARGTGWTTTIGASTVTCWGGRFELDTFARKLGPALLDREAAVVELARRGS